jgi:CubicO group peptidase (beta-lactamase class C family)
VSSIGVPVQAQVQPIPPEKLEELPSFLDATIPRLMEQQHIVGSAVAVARDGRLVFLKGYGKSVLETGASVDPQRTLFRIGSVTKALTAVAVMQLVEDGAVDLRRDVRDYLPDIPVRYGANAHHLLTHTSGLDERFAGSYTSSPEHLQSLTEHLHKYTPDQLYGPGRAYSYSNYNYALAGLLVERLSGVR